MVSSRSLGWSDSKKKRCQCWCNNTCILRISPTVVRFPKYPHNNNGDIEHLPHQQRCNRHLFNLILQSLDFSSYCSHHSLGFSTSVSTLPASYRSTSARFREAFPVSPYVSLHQMADMNDAAMNDILATPVLGENNDQDNREVVRWCHGCKERVESATMTAPCGHPYCRECIIKWFSLAGRYESMPRPHCCGQLITLESAGSLLSSDISKMFLAKAEEISSTNRIYCWDPECATFISPKAIDGRQAKCPSCRKLTCIVCKKEFHGGDCFEDPPAQSIMTAAAEAGFMQCFKCNRMVELDQGCRHIT